MRAWNLRFESCPVRSIRCKNHNDVPANVRFSLSDRSDKKGGRYEPSRWQVRTLRLPLTVRGWLSPPPKVPGNRPVIAALVPEGSRVLAADEVETAPGPGSASD
jgi:hypothetical protein